MRVRLTATAVVLLGVLVGVSVTAAQTPAESGILESAERLAAGVALQPPVAGGGISAGQVITTLALIGAGVGVAALAKPDYVPSHFIPGNTPSRVDIRRYLGSGNYPGHSYERARSPGPRYVCRGARCIGTATQWREQYESGVLDGAFAGLVVGHEQGWNEGHQAGQADLIRIMDANGLTVYEGEFIPASYTKEQFNDKAALRIGGVALAAAGGLAALFWPDSPARSLDLTPLPGGGRVGASFGF